MKCISQFYIGSCPSCCHWLLCFRAFFSRCISFGTSQKNKPSGWWNRLLVSLDLQNEMKSLCTGIPKRFSPKGFWYKPKTWRLWDFILLYHVEYLILTCQALKLKHWSFQTPRFDTKKYAKGDTDLWLCKPIDEGNTLEFLGHFFGWNHSLGHWSWKWGRSWKSSLSKRLF